ncbi:MULTISPECIES: hypothetical protein [unclassified Phyllobacterium]|uniref:hypothetical protein n=1 Tax=unclassified Phyllobacterium TaxID=2638441 RepID=UPI003012A5A9
MAMVEFESSMQTERPDPARPKSEPETKFPPHILMPIWAGMIATCLLFWAAIARLVLDF